MKRFLVIFLLMTVLVLGGILVKRYAVSPYAKITNIQSKGEDILIIGDSITRGFGITEEDAYPTLLEKELGIRIIKEARDGETISSALGRLEDIFSEKNPWIVIVFLGGNDFLAKAPRDLLLKNLSGIIEGIQARGAIVVLVGIRTGVLTEDYGEAYKELQKQYRTGYVPNILGGIIGHDDLMLDPIHPNEKGHEMIAERILKVLKPLIAESKKYR